MSRTTRHAEKKKSRFLYIQSTLSIWFYSRKMAAFFHCCCCLLIKSPNPFFIFYFFSFFLTGGGRRPCWQISTQTSAHVLSSEKGAMQQREKKMKLVKKLKILFQCCFCPARKKHKKRKNATNNNNNSSSTRMFSLFDLCARRFTEINKTTQTSFLLSHKIFLFFSANPWKEKASRRAGPLSLGWTDL